MFRQGGTASPERSIGQELAELRSETILPNSKDSQMPVAKIHVLEGRYDEARLGKLSGAVQQALMSALGIPPDDFFQIIQVLPRNQFLHTPSFLGLHYSDDLILLDITFIAGRPREKRLGLLKALNERVVAACGISPDDLMITLYEVPGENISFGQGLAQRAHISDNSAKTTDQQGSLR
jgi:phenylpyruvate tautomerase PptA (4-oxalocrotonate tautomerase family)